MAEAPTLRRLILSQLRTYAREARGPDAKSIASSMAVPVTWREVLTELKKMDADHLVRGQVMRGSVHWTLTDRGRREANGS